MVYSEIRMSETKTVSFKATEEQVESIDRAVEEGNYTSRGEYLRDLLRKEFQPRLSEEAVERIEKGREQIAAGKVKELDEV